MGQHPYRRRATLLWALILFGVAYSSLLNLVGTLTGTQVLDGIASVMLGLYLCSHPAANAVNLFFYERGALHQATSEWSGLAWLALNVLVVLVGWLVILNGMIRLVD